MFTRCLTRASIATLLALTAVACSADRTATTASPTSPGYRPPTPTVTVTVTPPAPSSAQASSTTPTEPVPCSDDDLAVSAGQVSEDGPTRRVTVSFANTSTVVCTLTGYPDADLVTAAGGVLVHVERRPANAAPRLTLHPGEVAVADIEASAIDNSTGGPCGRIGTLQITPPNMTRPRLLEVNLPICAPTTSSVT